MSGTNQSVDIVVSKDVEWAIHDGLPAEARKALAEANGKFSSAHFAIKSLPLHIRAQLHRVNMGTDDLLALVARHGNVKAAIEEIRRRDALEAADYYEAIEDGFRG